jgi:hypothetical protein
MRARGASGVGRARGTRELMRKEQEEKNVFSSPAARPGEEERGIVSPKTTPFCFPFFLTMKRRRFIQNAPFHLMWCHHIFPNSVLNLSFVLLSPHNVIWILRINSIAFLPISVSALIVGHAFHFSPWPLIYAIGPSIDQ